MGTILHEGEYILISKKITVETQYIGYSVLSHIGINTSKVNYIGSTTNFLTYSVIEDLELPFVISVWQNFTIKDTSFHAYTKATKNLILIKHHEPINYTDEIHEFFEKKKEAKQMVLKANKCVYIATTAYGATDGKLISAIFGFLPPAQDMDMRRIVGDESKYLFSKNKIFKDLYFTAMEATMRLHIIDSGLEFTMTSQGDIIIYRKNNFRYTLEEILNSYERYIEETKNMILKKGNSIYTAVTTASVTVKALIEAILGFLPEDKDTYMIAGSESKFLWSKTKLSNDTYYSAIDASVRLHEIDNDLDFTVTNRGDVVIYRTSNCSYTPREVIDSYERYIKEDETEIKDDNKEDLKMIIEVNRYIYIASNTINLSDGELISALFSYVPTCTKYEPIHWCADLLWSRTKFLHERSFDLIDAERRLHEKDETLEFVWYKGDIIIYRNTSVHTLKDILDAYDEYNKKDEPTLNTDSIVSLHCKPFITMPRNLGRSAAVSMLNSVYGLNPKFQGGLLKWITWDNSFKLYFGVERATGKQKTVCLWEDGEKTIICGDNNVTKLPVAQAFAWCYVKRTFRTVSHFKKHVDKRTTKMDGVWYFEGDCLLDEYAQGSVPGSSKKRDIYDAAALAIVTKRYGGLRKLVDEYINKEDTNDNT